GGAYRRPRARPPRGPRPRAPGPPPALYNPPAPPHRRDDMPAHRPLSESAVSRHVAVCDDIAGTPGDCALAWTRAVTLTSPASGSTIGVADRARNRVPTICLRATVPTTGARRCSGQDRARRGAAISAFSLRNDVPVRS